MSRPAALLRALVLGLVALFAAATTAVAAEHDELPAGVELPIAVRIAVRVLNVTEVKEVAGQAHLAVEVTQRWTDPRRRFDAVEVGAARVDRVGEDADQFLKAIWTPGLVADNQIGEAKARSIAVSAHASGEIVVVERYESDFRVAMTMAAFPFDQQQLKITFSLPRYPKQEAMLVTTEADRLFSHVEPTLSVVDWQPLGLGFANAETTGWNARAYSRLEASVTIDRLSERYILRIFVPIVAVLAVSVYVLWAPGLKATEKGNMIFSALLALAALSFTFESSFPGSISLNTPVAQIISLGYIYLVIVLLLDSVVSAACEKPDSALHRPCRAIRRHMTWSLPLIMVIVCAGAVVRALPV
jgi:hypothetical protein